MARYALVSAGYVQNVMLWDGEAPHEPEGLTPVLVLDNSPVSPGWTYDGMTFTAPATPASTTHFVNKIDFRALFTQAETLAFNVERRHVDALQPADYTDPSKAGIVAFEVFLDDYNDADQLDLMSDLVAQGLALMVSLGIIASDRVAQVIAGTPPA